MKILLAIATLLLLVSTVFADTIAVIGTGRVGSALGPEFAAQGHTIIYGSREPSSDRVLALVAKTGDEASATTPRDAAEHADIVVLAVPGLLVKEIMLGLGDLSGKIIIDPTNPLATSNAVRTLAVDTSNAEILQAAAPDSHVVKAFSTLGSRTMIDPGSSGGPVTVLIVGNNDQAKAKVAELVEGMGLEALDLGPVEYAHWVEGMTLLFINNRFGSDRQHFDYHLRKN